MLIIILSDCHKENMLFLDAMLTVIVSKGIMSFYKEESYVITKKYSLPIQHMKSIFNWCL